MITGFNTDIDYAGVTYHIQTEDKGLESPLILSLVYVGGAILASKRTYYQDLIDAGFEQVQLVERLQRQHKLICAAVRAGRIEELKRMNERDAPARPSSAPKVASPAPKVEAKKSPVVKPKPAPVVEQKSAPVVEQMPVPAVSIPPTTITAPPLDQLDILSLSDADPLADSLIERTPVLPPAPEIVREVVKTAPPESVPVAPQAEEVEPETDLSAFYIRLLDDEGEFRAGELVMIRVHVGRGQYGRIPVRDAAVTVKVLGTTFRPLIVSTETDEEGVAIVRALLPRFTSGRAAILIRARADGYEAELRRIIKQA